MRLPPDLILAALDIQTSAVPNTNVTTQVRAAPGAGFRLRLWYVSISPNSTAQVMVQKFRGIWSDVNGTAQHTQYAAAEAGGSLHSLTDYFPGGLVLPTNSRIDCIHSCSVASLFWRLQIGYTIEAVA